MALTPQQVQALRQKYNISVNATPSPTENTGKVSDLLPKKDSVILRTLRDIPGDIKETFKGAVEDVSTGIEKASDIQKQVEEGTISPTAGMVSTIGAGLKAGAGVVGQGLIGAGKLFTSPETEEKVSKKVSEVSKEVIESAPVQALIQKYESLTPEQKSIVDGTLGTVEGLSTLFGLGPTARAIRTGISTGVKTAENLATSGAQAAKKTITSTAGEIVASTKGTISAAKPLVEDITGIAKGGNITPVKALGEIAQGKTKDLRSVAKAIEDINVSKVNTFNDFLSQIDKKIPEFAKEVDKELAKDSTVYKLKDLSVKEVTKAGKEVSTDYVTKALKDLYSLYSSIGEKVNAQNMKDLLARARKSGLTRKEVNDLSRTYGNEFGSKAFGKTGEPLTSVGAQAFENTRSGLKTSARSGKQGAKAKELDLKISALENTKKLVKANAEAVNKLKQRIQERGLLEKAGNFLTKYADVLTGGTIRGMIGGLLPRGAGYKTMNALDIEEALRKNLEIVQKALKQKSDKELLEILKTKTAK